MSGMAKIIVGLLVGLAVALYIYDPEMRACRDSNNAARVEAWRALGATHIAVDTMRAGFTSPQAHIDAIRSFRDVL